MYHVQVSQILLYMCMRPEEKKENEERDLIVEVMEYMYISRCKQFLSGILV